MKNESKAWQMENFMSKKLKSKQQLGLFRLLFDRTFKKSISCEWKPTMITQNTAGGLKI